MIEKRTIINRQQFQHIDQNMLHSIPFASYHYFYAASYYDVARLLRRKRIIQQGGYLYVVYEV